MGRATWNFHEGVFVSRFSFASHIGSYRFTYYADELTHGLVLVLCSSVKALRWGLILTTCRLHWGRIQTPAQGFPLYHKQAQQSKQIGS